MLHPLIGYTMRGVIWYQGEDNYDRAWSYADQLSTMVRGWRTEWGQGDFPFYFCQIAPYDYSLLFKEGEEVPNSAFLREQQAKAAELIPNSGMAVLLDAGLETCIHPRQKNKAGERLALQALCKTYGMKGLVCDPPVYKEMEVKGDTVIITFDRNKMWPAGKGVFTSKNFQVAGEDRVFHPAEAWIVQKHVYVKSSEVAHSRCRALRFHELGRRRPLRRGNPRLFVPFRQLARNKRHQIREADIRPPSSTLLTKT